ncbi:MAG: HemK family protein methyltransferase [Patescibacteria group bacterium]|nr:HemK family protein methyltransferase [Patescibacteria group bacterium]
MDLKELDWLLNEKYRLVGAVNKPDLWPAEVAEDLRRLDRGEPLAYVIGFVPFLNSRIDLRFRPLIPRAETEYWVETLLNYSSLRDKKISVLDLFTGSGCIGLSVLKYWPRAEVDFVDNSPGCLEQVECNLFLNQIDSNRANLILSDVFDQVSEKYDLILANPPYIDSDLFQKLPIAVRKYEPREALVAGKRGMAIMEKFFKQLSDHLKPNSQFWLEFDSSQKEAIRLILENKFKLDFRMDQYQCWRFLVGQPWF